MHWKGRKEKDGDSEQYIPQWIWANILGRDTCKDQNIQFKSKSLRKKTTETAGIFLFIINKRNSKEINQNVFLLS